MDWFSFLPQPLWKFLVEISIFWAVFYVLFVYIKDSGMIQALKGMAIFAVLFLVARWLDLKSIHWIFTYLFQISIIGFVIIFQPELRRGLTRIGQSPLFKFFLKEEKVADEIVRAVMAMSQSRIGAIIAVEREMSLKSYVESGIPLDGVLTAELLLTIFAPNTPFHDGGVVVQAGRVTAVGCLFPLSQSQALSRTLGTRHRAGLGLSEETDAVAIVVSEETGTVSVMRSGKIERDVSADVLKDCLYQVSEPSKSKPLLRRPLSGGAAR